MVLSWFQPVVIIPTPIQFSDLSLTDIASPLTQAEDGLARLDKRLRASPIGEGRRSRLVAGLFIEFLI